MTGDGEFLTALIRRSLEEEAARTGLSVEEVRLKRREEWAKAGEEEARREREADAAERESRLLEALRHPDATITRSRTALGRAIRWTGSRYNALRKDEVVDAILRATAPVPEDLVGAACVRSASFSCGSFTPSSSMNAGATYELRVTGAGAFLVADFGAPAQRVCEIRRAPGGEE